MDTRGLAGDYRIVSLELHCDDEIKQMTGALIINCNRTIPGTKADVEEMVAAFEQCCGVKVQYPTDWEETK